LKNTSSGLVIFVSET